MSALERMMADGPPRTWWTGFRLARIASPFYRAGWYAITGSAIGVAGLGLYAATESDQTASQVWGAILGMVLGIHLMLGLPLWLYNRRSQSRLHRFMRDARLVVGTVTSTHTQIVRTRRGGRGKRFELGLRFEAEGHKWRATACGYGPPRLAVGAEIKLLQDPAQHEAIRVAAQGPMSRLVAAVARVDVWTREEPPATAG